jgi:uncharacterized repeat protein (TIGR04052 family)
MRLSRLHLRSFTVFFGAGAPTRALFSGAGAPTRALSLGLAAALAGCSGQDATAVRAERVVLPEQPSLARTGTVALAISAGGISVRTLRATVRDAVGTIILDNERDVSSTEATFEIELVVPVGARYSLSLSAENEASVRCTGEAEFDVVENATIVVPLSLTCEPSGGVRVVGTLTTPEACPSVELAALAAPVTVGTTVRLAAAAPSGGNPSYAWAASGGTLASSSSATATFTCTESGPVTVTLTASDSGCSDTASTVVECTAPADDACAGLGSSCHVVDPGSGPLHECHELGHGGDAQACSLGRASCVDACGEALCTTLGSFCHPVDPGSGPLHECHELGHAGDAAACFERGRECFDRCSEARAAASQPIQIEFEARVGEEEFGCDRVYSGVGSSQVDAEPQDLRFFVSDVRLIEASGRQEPVALDVRELWQTADVALLDFEDGSGLCASGTAAVNSTLHGRVFPGDYVGIAFTLGVPESINHADPALQPAPLELGSMSWGWLLGYRFLRAEMAPVSEGEPVPGAALLHLGSTSCSGNPQAGTVVCTRPNRNEVRLDEFDALTNSVVIDVGALFANTDLAEDSLCHSTGEFCAGPFSSLGIDSATGAASDGQTVFRVE